MGGWTPTLQAGGLRDRAWEKLVKLRPEADLALLQEATSAPARLELDLDVPRSTTVPVRLLRWIGMNGDGRLVGP